MSITQLHVSEYCIPVSLFTRWQAFLRTHGGSGDHTWILTEACFQGETQLPLIAVVAQDSALLLHCVELSQNHQYRVQYSTDPLHIRTTLESLKTQAPPTPRDAVLEEALRALSDAVCITPQPNLLSQLLEGLLSEVESLTPVSASPVVIPQSPSSPPAPSASGISPPAPDDLFHAIVRQMRDGAALPVILQTAIEQAQQILNADRILLYQYASPLRMNAAAPGQTEAGELMHEVRRNETIPSFSAQQEGLQWPTGSTQFHQYSQGLPIFTQRVANPTHLLDGPTNLLYQNGVRAQLIVPILVSGQLRGLCIVHQFEQAHQWHPSDIAFLEKMVEYLSVAMQQTDLQKQLQYQQRTLAEQVQKRTQELQDLLQAAQSANQTKSKFLATVSHELRTPLTCVIGMSATLLRWSLGPLTDKQRSYLQTIHDSGEHLLELINDILDFSQVAAGKATLNVSEFSLSSLAQQSLQLFRDKATSQEILLKANLKIPPGRDRFVADPRRVKQIIVNLLSNAVKFTPAGGKVILRVWLEPNTAVFQVEDTGIGISPQQQPLLFQSFQQLDTSYQRNYDGTGLGLALTKQFVDMHHGWIEVQSVEGKGSIFTVELPEQTRIMASKGEQHYPSYGKDHSNTRLILIEDQEENATLICEMLTAAGFHVVWLVDASTAMEQSRFLQPIAILISMELPDSNGQQLMRQFRQSIETRHLKLIALTSSLSAREQQKLLTNGADAYLTKPLDPEHLVHKVETLLSSTAPPAWP
jgi:two-component system sensor histidine kinase/response regulator